MQNRSVALDNSQVCHVAGVQNLNPRVMPAGRKSMVAQCQVDVAFRVCEADDACLSHGDQGGLAWHLRVEELSPAAPFGQPSTLIICAAHEGARQDAHLRCRAVPSESDDGGIETSEGQCMRQAGGGEFAHRIHCAQQRRECGAGTLVLAAGIPCVQAVGLIPCVRFNRRIHLSCCAH